MFRFAWAYQNSGGGGDPTPYPIQTVNASVGVTAPFVTASKSAASVSIRDKIPVASSGPGQLHIFVKR